jgi:hypothetical protein
MQKCKLSLPRFLFLTRVPWFPIVVPEKWWSYLCRVMMNGCRLAIGIVQIWQSLTAWVRRGYGAWAWGPDFEITRSCGWLLGKLRRQPYKSTLRIICFWWNLLGGLTRRMGIWTWGSSFEIMWSRSLGWWGMLLYLLIRREKVLLASLCSTERKRRVQVLIEYIFHCGGAIIWHVGTQLCFHNWRALKPSIMGWRMPRVSINVGSRRGWVDSLRCEDAECWRWCWKMNC